MDEPQSKMRKLIISTSPSVVFSILALTALAPSMSSSTSKGADMMGVLMFFDAFMISLIRGTPRVISDHRHQGNALVNILMIILYEIFHN